MQRTAVLLGLMLSALLGGCGGQGGATPPLPAPSPPLAHSAGPLSINRLSTSSGTIGTSITIYGTGFTTDNTVVFVGAVHASYLGATSNDGVSLTFSIPNFLTGDTPCDPMLTAPCIYPPTSSGTYTVSVQNESGPPFPYPVSNSLLLTVTN